MGKGYKKTNDNVYLKARLQAAEYNETLKTREGAANQLGVSVYTLADYELGTTKVVPVDKVMLMADLYRCPQLAAGYCKHECPIGKTRPIATETSGVEGAALRLLRELNSDKLKDIREQIVEIASDGEISEDEQQEMKEVMKQLDNIMYAITEMRLLAEKASEK